MVWYQVFGYAIAHWLQKVAEHVFGCVLCSPGCFSLFRGSALMDDNVMNRYTTMAEKPVEFVQYDQGEDRWLCTLLLQQGYRVEYCAGSDALTFAPESLSEYFTQQRRWITSTMANVLDLISSYKTTVEKNRDISYFFMLYQTILFLASLLAPATIVTLIAGSYNAILGTPLLQSYLLGLSIAVFYTMVCLFLKNDTQIQVGILISAVYAIVMMLVLVALIINSSYESIYSPNVAFLTAITLLFLLTALLHPRELFCLVPGLLYMFAIPFSLLFLMIYSICNMNVVSWGTREVAAAKSKEEIEQEELEEKERKEKAKNSSILNLLGLGGFVRDVREFYKTTVSRNVMGPTSEVSEMSERMKAMEEILKEVVIEKKEPRNELREMLQRGQQKSKPKPPPKPQVKKAPEPAPSIKSEPEDPNKPFWLQDEAINEGKLRLITDKESDFWSQMLKKYLHPIDSDKRKEKQIATGLQEMKINVVMGMSMLNFMWILLLFLFQVLKETLGEELFIPIPQEEGRIEFFEPVGLIFLSFFAFLLLTQFMATIWHRLVTIMHLLAITKISSSKTKVLEEAILLTNKLQSLKPAEELSFCEPPADYDEDEQPNVDFAQEVAEDQHSDYHRLASLQRGNPRPWVPQEPRGFYPAMMEGSSDHLDQFGVPMDADSYFHRQRPQYNYSRSARPRYNQGVRDVSGGTLSHNFNRRFERFSRFHRNEGRGQVSSRYFNVLDRIRQNEPDEVDPDYDY